MARLLQLTHPTNGRQVALAVNDELFLIKGVASVYELALKALREKKSLTQVATETANTQGIPYDPIYKGQSDWRILPPLDHPTEPARCLVSGTGLTHRQSAANRDAMHAAGYVTDSMKIYQWGEAEGRPASGSIGVQPEWFYKGSGTILKAHNEALEVHAFCDDGGEEPEIAGLYLIDDEGVPRRLGYAIGNEFSDHKMEKKNYLYLAPSKLRQCSIGPELVSDASFDDIPGEVRIERSGRKVWSAALKTGEANMVHSLANLEHHHFKYPQHRRPGDVHVHFFGTSAFSFGAGVALQDGDEMFVELQNFGRALKNILSVEKEPLRMAKVKAI